MPEAAQTAEAPARRPARKDVLDRSRHFEVTYSANGSPQFPYFQDGKAYDHGGERIETSGDKKLDAQRDAAEKKRRAEQIEKHKKAVEALQNGEDPDPDENTLNGVNLYLWAKGEQNVRFALVRKAIEDRYHRSVHNELDAREFLIDVKLVSVAEVARFLGDRGERAA